MLVGNLNNYDYTMHMFVSMYEQVYTAGLQIYGGRRSLSHDFKLKPITFRGSGLSDPILFSCELHKTVVNTVKHVLSSHSKKDKTKNKDLNNKWQFNEDQKDCRFYNSFDLH